MDMAGSPRLVAFYSNVFGGNNCVHFMAEHIQSCSICDQAKHHPDKPSGFLYPLPVPTKPFEILYVDFVLNLPIVRGYNTIFVCLENLSKLVNFLLCPFEEPRLIAEEFESIFLIY